MTIKEYITKKLIKRKKREQRENKSQHKVDTKPDEIITKKENSDQFSHDCKCRKAK